MISKFKINFDHPEAEHGGFDVEQQRWRRFTEEEKEILNRVPQREADVEINTETGAVTVTART